MEEDVRLIEAQIPRLRRYARALLHDKDRADDLVQDTLVRELDKISTWAFSGRAGSDVHTAGPERP